MRLTKRLTFLPALLFMVVCAYGQDVHYNYDRSANFAVYNTYQWVDLPGGAVADQLIDQAIKRAVDEQLAQKGLTRVEKNAELYVGYHAGIHEERSVNLWSTGDGFGGWGGWGGWGSGTVQGQTSTISVGTLMVDRPWKKAADLARRCQQDHRP